MNTYEFLEWLESKQLTEQAKSNSKVLKKVLTYCLAASEEEVLIIGDEGYQEKRVAALLTGGYYFAAKELGLNARIIVQEPRIRGDSAEDAIIDALKNLPRKSIIIMNFSSKLGSIKEISNSYRTYAREQQHKFVSATNLANIPSLNFDQLLNAIDVDYEKMHKKAQKIYEILEKGKEVRITTEKGTDLTIGIEGMNPILNTGMYNKPGLGGNIPAGEVYIPPKWKNVEGKIVIDGSSAHMGGAQLIEEPIVMTVKKGEVISIEGGEEARKLEETLQWAEKKAKYPWGIRRVCELGIGINPNANLIGTTIVDEKKIGTAHIALGSNYWFGGTIYAIIHLDQVFKNPVITVDGKILEL